MGSKHKISQNARREARKAYKCFSDELRNKLGVFNEALRPKPKLIPKKIWKMICLRVIDIDKLKKETGLKT